MRNIKRLFDLIIASICLLIAIPIILVCIILQLHLEGRPIFYVSFRYNSLKETIKIYKFRTMVKNPYDPIYRIQSYLIDGFYQIPLNSNIYTKFGRFLEKYQIVELFQLINVLKGEMSIVGNRPLPEKNHQKIKLINRWSYRYCSPSGITGIAQICNKNELTSKERINLEAKYSIIYMRNNFLILILDIYILYRTFLFVLFGVKLNKYKANTILNSILYN